MLGCLPTWRTEDNTHRRDGASSSASTLEECRTDCSVNSSCTAIDWNAGASDGQQCWLHGSWSTGSTEPGPAIQHHIINRTCTQSQTPMFFFGAVEITLPYLTFGVGRLLHLPSAEAVSVRPNAQPRCNERSQ